jgi:hypothetical protein
MIRTGPGMWNLSFDSRVYATTARRQVDIAAEFVGEAADALAKGRSHAAADLLFSGVELLAGAELMLLPLEKRPSGRTSHAWVSMAYNRRSKAGNASSAYAKLLNELSGLRNRARYRFSPLEAEALKGLVERAQDMERATRAQLPRRTQVDPRLLAGKPKPPPHDL